LTAVAHTALGERDEGESPERRLIAAIILAAIEEALGIPAAGESASTRARNRESALRWFTEKGQDFCALSLAAGYEPNALSRAALAFIAAHSNATAGKRVLNVKNIMAFHSMKAAA